MTFQRVFAPQSCGWGFFHACDNDVTALRGPCRGHHEGCGYNMPCLREDAL